MVDNIVGHVCRKEGNCQISTCDLDLVSLIPLWLTRQHFIRTFTSEKTSSIKNEKLLRICLAVLTQCQSITDRWAVKLL